MSKDQKHLPPLDLTDYSKSFDGLKLPFEATSYEDLERQALEAGDYEQANKWATIRAEMELADAMREIEEQARRNDDWLRRYERGEVDLDLTMPILDKPEIIEFDTSMFEDYLIYSPTKHMEDGPDEWRIHQEAKRAMYEDFDARLAERQAEKDRYYEQIEADIARRQAERDQEWQAHETRVAAYIEEKQRMLIGNPLGLEDLSVKNNIFNIKLEKDEPVEDPHKKPSLDWDPSDSI